MGGKDFPPLSVHFVWHPSDEGNIRGVLDSIKVSLARDINRPFSRGLNIPLFFYSSENQKASLKNPPQNQCEKNILFLFLSVNTAGCNSWYKYIEEISSQNFLEVVPISLDCYGLGHTRDGESLKNKNCLRLDKLREKNATLSIFHEIYRHGFSEINNSSLGKDSSLKIFISHTKENDIGHQIADSIRRYINDDTNLLKFYDTTDIPSGFDFHKDIANNIEKSAVIMIESDKYSARYWCQREILWAKLKNCPMIAVNCLEKYEDRGFPAAANVPSIHLSPNIAITEDDILDILITVLLETIRFKHALRSLEFYDSKGWMGEDCELLLARPPEIRQVIPLIREKKNREKLKICYPDPPLYVEETDWLADLGIEACTPLWNRERSFRGKKIGISISEVPIDGHSKQSLDNDHVERLSQDIARHLLACSSIIIYGGDLRKDGFTQFILDEAIALKNRIKSKKPHVKNYLPWPSYLSQSDITAWRAKYRPIIDTIECPPPEDIGINHGVCMAPSGPDNKYIWSRCLTCMRHKSIDDSDFRICAGGKVSGYNGKMPGVLEEVLIAIEKNKPIYLLGGFGGCIGDICQTISKKSIANSLTENWQIENNAGYSELQKKAKQYGHHADYKEIEKILCGIDIKHLSSQVGLDESQYRKLMECPFIDECIHLIIEGIQKILRDST